MLSRKILLNINPLLLKQKCNSDFLITAFIISLITIMGVFMSHYNNDMFISRFRAIDSVVISTDLIDEDVAKISNKTIIATHTMRT